MDAPRTRYVRVDGAHVAYQVSGEGPESVLFMLGLSTHLEAMWDEPGLARYLRRIAEFSRLVMFDRRGAGLSDPLTEGGTLDAHVDDALAVLDAAGIERVSVVAANEAALIAVPFAARHPSRVNRLVIVNGTARFMWAEDYEIGAPWRVGREYSQAMTDSYTDRTSGIAATAPSMLGDAAFEAWALRYQRQAASPGSSERTTRLVGRTDVRSVLPLVTCPVLVMHRRGDRFLRVDHGQYLADHLADATFVELDGADHLPWTGPDTDRSLDEIEKFVTGDAAVARASDRVLATIVFTDIVGSTEHLGRVGDRRWAELVDAHNALVAGVVRGGNGRIVDTAGDGVFAVFDAPSRGIIAAAAICARVASLGLTVRAGVHTGEVEVVGDAVRGVAVHTAARVMAAATDGGIVVSRTVHDLVSGSGFRFESLGAHELKGLADPIELYAVSG
jgi:class 3 adenylate cyclase